MRQVIGVRDSARWRASGGGVRLTLALSCWLAMAAPHRLVADAVAKGFEAPWGFLVPARYAGAVIGCSIAALLAYLLAHAFRGQGRLPTLGLWTLWLALAFACQQVLVTAPAEAIHYPQYALVAVLLAHALDPTRQRVWLTEPVLAGAALSLVDEGLQYLLLMDGPAYFDFNDLALNQLGGLAGLLLYYGFPAAAPRSADQRRWRVRLLAGYAIAAAIVCVLLASGVLALRPEAPIALDDLWSTADGPRLFLQREPDAHAGFRASRSGDDYYVLGPFGWLITLAATLLLAWRAEAEFREPPRRHRRRRGD